MGNTNLKASDLDPDNFQGKCSSSNALAIFSKLVSVFLDADDLGARVADLTLAIPCSDLKVSEILTINSIILCLMQLYTNKTSSTTTVSARAASEKCGELSERKRSNSLR